MGDQPRVWRSQTARNRMRGIAGTSVTIVSEAPEALSALQQFFGRVGVVSHTTRAVRDLDKVAPTHADATILFFDDFDEEAALATIDDLRRKRPTLLVVLVARDHANLRHALCEEDDEQLPMPTVLSAPLTLGESLLDVLRRHNQDRRR